MGQWTVAFEKTLRTPTTAPGPQSSGYCLEHEDETNWFSAP